jgi:hypothetical protein
MTKIDMKGNFLELVPERNRRWEKTGDGRIYLLVPRFTNRLMKKIALGFGKSELVKVNLDDKGTVVWMLIDGKKNVKQIGDLMEKQEGETRPQVYERLSEFLSILARNRFIRLKQNTDTGA